MSTRASACLGLLVGLLLWVSVLEPMRPPTPGDPATGPRFGDEIVVCGHTFHTGTRVLLWTDEGGYDAYSTKARFGPRTGDGAPPEGKRRYHPGRRHGEGAYLVEPGSRDIEAMRSTVDQFVLHYDACGTSRRCFEVLHDIRGLSVHFMLDTDGTIYQTLDLRERAWHAAHANTRSVGVEIAHPGSVEARAETRVRGLEAWYAEGESGRTMVPPAFLGPTGIRTPNFVIRPARPQRIEGLAQGVMHVQYDYTDEQYLALSHLTASLHRILPRIELQVPRDVEGAVESSVLSAEQQDAMHGLVGHQHVSGAKTDPGPAFDWERVLERVSRLLNPQDFTGL
jgi:N-acetylmuramoyl-L-alanine amidase